MNQLTFLWVVTQNMSKYVIDKFFNTILQRFQQVEETSNDKGSEFIPESVELLYHYFQKNILEELNHT